MSPTIDSDKPAPKSQENKKDDILATLHNPAKDKNSGQIWPIFLLIVVVSIGWLFNDPELRRGLGQITGFHAIEPLVEAVVSREFIVTIHGTWNSACTQRVMLMAHEKELEIEMKLVNMSSNQHKTPKHLEMHPFGQIPVLEINEHTHIYESRAIAHWLERRWPSRGNSFAMTNITLAMVQHDQALSFEAFDFDPAAHAIYKEAVMKPRNGKTIDEAALKAALATLDSKMDAYERVLSHRTYLGGNLTLADLYHLPLGTKLIQAGHGAALTDEKHRPHVAKWWKGLYGRPSWQAVLKDVAAWEEEQKKEREAHEKEREAHEKEVAEHAASAGATAVAAASAVSAAASAADHAAEHQEKKHHGIFH